MDRPTCEDCQDLEITTPAPWRMPSGTRLCDAHWRKRTGQPLRRGQRVPQGASAVAIRRLDVGLAGRREPVSENCKCGRDGKHKGRCWARRGLSRPPSKSELGGARSPAAAGRKFRAGAL